MPTGPELRLPPTLEAIVSQAAAFLEGTGVRAYATGGFVRDLYLRRPVADLDISIDANPLDIGPRLAETLGGIYFPLDIERRHARVLLTGGLLHIDLLPLRGDIEQDLRLRDYTLGALAASLPSLASGSATVIDPTGGVADLRDGRVRLISEQALLDDPLRLLRGVRLATRLGFALEPQTASLIRRHALLIRQAVPERQRDEFLLIMATESAATGVRLLDDVGLLTLLIPELDVARGVEQPKEHQWDVFGHGIEAVAALDWLLSDEEPTPEPAATLWRELWEQLAWWPPAMTRLLDELSPGVRHYPVLKVAALLHDIGKPATKSLEPDGRIRFFGHSEAGADIAAGILRRLRFPTRLITHVRAMIDAHLRPLLIAREGPPSKRAILRFFRDTGDAGIDTLFLSLADHLATVGPRVTAEGWRRHVAVVAFIIATYLERPVAAGPERLIAGEDLMNEFGLDPGPLIGELLAVVQEAQEAGEVSSRDEALALAGRHLARKAGNP